ncbi:MAG: hypothetical protein R6W78_01540 [Bacteroidales bacterium]
MNNIENEAIFSRAKKQLVYNFIPFLAAYLFFVVRLLFKQGYVYDPETKVVSQIN